jgi:5'-nucleotidase
VDRRHLAPGAAAFVAAGAVALLGLPSGAEQPPPEPAPDGRVHIRLLGVNDLHGHLEPPRPGIGGAAWLKAHLDRASLPGRTIRVHAGDMVGTSPLVSSHFHDEPTIEAANEIGFDVGTVGNHEFDEGGDELLRLLRGGRRTGPEALRPAAHGGFENTSSPDYAGAGFPYLAANTLDRDGEPLLAPYKIVERAGARIGFIGVTTPSTPKWLLPRHAERFRYLDVSDTVNRWVPELRRRGVEAIVVLAHEGAPTQIGVPGPRAEGPIVRETRQMSDEVDVVIAGHSHSQLDLRIGNKVVVEALSYGVGFDLVDIVVDRRSGEIVQKSASVPATTHTGVAPDANVAALVGRYAARVAPLADRVVGQAREPLTRSNGGLARLAADAQRSLAGADVALVGNLSMRADLDAGPIAYDELARAQAYDHPVIRMRMKGRTLTGLLAGRGRGLTVSGPASFAPRATYTVAASELLAMGDWYPALRDRATGKRAVGTEVEALVAYLERR